MWGSLIKHNPEFKKVKNNLIREYSTLNKLMLSDNQINDQIKAIKLKHDTLVEYYGTQPDVKHLFAELALWFKIPAVGLNDFYHRYQELFLDYHPSLYDENTLNVLKALKEEGHTQHISSNTLFIDEPSMWEVLTRLGLIFRGQDSPISKAKFSCNEKVSKPHYNMFFEGTDYHVGDNRKTDGGCVSFGINFFEINSNDKTIKDFYEHIQSVSLCKEN